MIDWLADVVWRIGAWTYVLIFAGATLESAAFLGFLVPGETLVILAGVLVAAEVLDLPQALAVAIGGAVLGDSIGYEMGRHLGRPWLERHGARFGVGRRRLQRVDDLFARHGGKAVLLGRMVGFVRAFAPFVAGSARMRYSRFLVFNVAGAVIWGVAFVTLGYVLGASWWIAEKWLGRFGVAGGALVVVTAAWWLARRHRSVDREAAGSHPPDR